MCHHHTVNLAAADTVVCGLSAKQYCATVGASAALPGKSVKQAAVQWLQYWQEVGDSNCP